MRKCRYVWFHFVTAIREIFTGPTAMLGEHQKANSWISSEVKTQMFHFFIKRLLWAQGILGIPLGLLTWCLRITPLETCSKCRSQQLFAPEICLTGNTISVYWRKLASLGSLFKVYLNWKPIMTQEIKLKQSFPERKTSPNNKRLLLVKT